MSKLKERTPIPHCCPVCGGNWEGDGFTTPIHCERSTLWMSRTTLATFLQP